MIMDVEEKKLGMKITSYYKYLLILGGLILLFSLFNNVRILTQIRVILFALTTIFYGTLCWIRETNINDKIEQINLNWNYELSRMRTFQKLSENIDIRKEFEKKHRLGYLLFNYHRFNWIIFSLYVIVSLLIFFV